MSDTHTPTITFEELMRRIGDNDTVRLAVESLRKCDFDDDMIVRCLLSGGSDGAGMSATCGERIIKRLREGAIESPDGNVIERLSAAVGRAPNTVRQEVGRLAHRGLVERRWDRNGVYRVALADRALTDEMDREHDAGESAWGWEYQP